MRSRAVIKVILQAASALENTDSEPLALRKCPAPSLQKYSVKFYFNLLRAEFSGPPLDRSDQTDRKLPFRCAKPANFPLFFRRFQLYRGLGKGIDKGKSHSALGWPIVIGKCCAIILQLFQLVSDRSVVWHNRKQPAIVTKLLKGTQLVDGCSKWDASNAEWKFQRGCARSISTTFPGKTG